MADEVVEKQLIIMKPPHQRSGKGQQSRGTLHHQTISDGLKSLESHKVHISLPCVTTLQMEDEVNDRLRSLLISVPLLAYGMCWLAFVSAVCCLQTLAAFSRS